MNKILKAINTEIITITNQTALGKIYYVVKPGFVPSENKVYIHTYIQQPYIIVGAALC